MEIHEQHEVEAREPQTVETPVKEVYQQPLLIKHEALRDITVAADSVL